MLTAAILRGWVMMTLILSMGEIYPFAYSGTSSCLLLIDSLIISESMAYWGS